MRWGRFDTTISFYTIVDDEEALNMLSFYREKYNYQDIVTDVFLNKIKSKFIWLTYSVIADFFDTIKRSIDFHVSIGKTFDQGDAYMENIFNWLHVNKTLLLEIESAMDDWLRTIKNKDHPDDKLPNNIL